ncbi:MAG: endoglucanase, partial [Clostridia bacterium]|nr:endoglucanase [Clostridia bacterium]
PDPDPVVMKGDVHGNDEIDSVDYTMIKRGYFGTYNVEMNVGDINGNEEIDSIDYAMLKRAYFGIYQIQ